MITVAREARELVQSELARKLGVSQGKLSKVEGGVIEPSEELAANLVEVLGFPREFFEQSEATHGLGTDAYHQLYRRRKALPMKALRRIEAQVNIARMHTSKLLASLHVETDKTIPRLELEEFDNDVERIAATVRAAWLLPGGPIDNMIEAIENAGGIAIPFDFGTDQVDATSLRIGDLPPLIFYNRNLKADRCRFTLAHELGHLVMHSLLPNAMMEEQADRFAAEFLMPAREIGPQLNRLTIARAAQLKPYWKVSMGALIYRAKSLGKLTPNQSQHLWISMSAAGYRTNEPRELDIKPEEAKFHRQLIDFHLGELGYTVSEICRLLASSEADFRALHAVQDNSHVRLVGDVSKLGASTAKVVPFALRD